MDNFLRNERESEKKCYLSWDLFVRICLHLNYTELISLCELDPRIFYIIHGVSGPLPDKNSPTINAKELEHLSQLHDQLWRAKLNREGIPVVARASSIREPLQEDSDDDEPPNTESDLSPKSLFELKCVTYYVLELSSAPNYGIQEFFLCSTVDEIRDVLVEQFKKNRKYLQHLLSASGLDVILYVGYQDKMISMTPLYNLLKVQIGSESALTFNYLDGLEDLSSSYNIVLPGEGEFYLPNDKFVAHQRFETECRTCRYETIHWALRTSEREPASTIRGDNRQFFIGDSEIILNTLCPMGLSVDIVSLVIKPSVSETAPLPDLHPSGIPFTDERLRNPKDQVNVHFLHRTDSLDSISTATTEDSSGSNAQRSSTPSSTEAALRRHQSNSNFLKVTLRRGRNVFPRLNS